MVLMGDFAQLPPVLATSVLPGMSMTESRGAVVRAMALAGRQTFAGDRSDTMVPSCDVMPCDLWKVRAHAKRSGRVARTTDCKLLWRTSAQGTGTQVLGKS